MGIVGCAPDDANQQSFEASHASVIANARDVDDGMGAEALADEATEDEVATDADHAADGAEPLIFRVACGQYKAAAKCLERKPFCSWQLLLLRNGRFIRVLPPKNPLQKPRLPGKLLGRCVRVLPGHKPKIIPPPEQL
jgi:hypothetical protein